MWNPVFASLVGWSNGPEEPFVPWAAPASSQIPGAGMEGETAGIIRPGWSQLRGAFGLS